MVGMAEFQSQEVAYSDQQTTLSTTSFSVAAPWPCILPGVGVSFIVQTDLLCRKGFLLLLKLPDVYPALPRAGLCSSERYIHGLTLSTQPHITAAGNPWHAELGVRFLV